MNEISSIRPDDDVQPHNIEAEQQILGRILIENDAYALIAGVLQPEHFYDPVHRRIYEECGRRIRAGHLASPVSLKTAFESDEGLQQLGGVPYLVRMAGAAISVRALPDYCAIVLEAHQRRVIIRACQEAASMVRVGRSVGEAQGALESALSRLAMAETRQPSVSLLSAVMKSITMTNEAYQSDEGGGLLTGIPEWDEMTGGMFPGDSVVLAGATSMGKTMVALSVLDAVARRGHGVAVVSLEMSEHSLAQRLMAAQSKVPYFRLKSGKISEGEFRRTIEGAQELGKLPVEIILPHVREVGAIHGAIKRIQARMQTTTPKGLGLVVIDYLQLVRAVGRDTRERVSEASIGVKSIAMQLGVPVLVLSQIGRDVEQRDGHRPKLSDLSDSSQIEKDADMVIFAHREHYYLKREGAQRNKAGHVTIDALADYEAALKATEHQMDLIWAKNRNGAIGEVKVGCDVTLNRLWSLKTAQEAMSFDQGS